MANKTAYIASSFRKKERRDNVVRIKSILSEMGVSCYVPMEHKIEGAWSLTNKEWAKRVMASDLDAIDRSDFVLFVCYNDEGGQQGSAFECGYAYSKGKPIVAVMMNEAPIGLMLGSSFRAMINGIDEITKYDFDALPSADPIREQR
jgi:nucleoside 2-deoxyribosyltransferase